jgi:hypothetical protein
MVRMEQYPPATQQQQQPVERYYGRPGHGREDEEVVFLERGPPGMREGGYR